MVGENRVREGGRAETSLTCAHFVGLLSPRRPDATRRSSGVSRIVARPFVSQIIILDRVLSTSSFSSVLVISVARGQSAVSSRRIVDQQRRDDDRVECARRAIFHKSVFVKKENCHNVSLDSLCVHAGSLCAVFNRRGSALR